MVEMLEFKMGNNTNGNRVGRYDEKLPRLNLF